MSHSLLSEPNQCRHRAQDDEIDDERQMQGPRRILRKQTREQRGEAETEEVGAGANDGSPRLVVLADQLGGFFKLVNLSHAEPSLRSSALKEVDASVTKKRKSGQKPS